MKALFTIIYSLMIMSVGAQNFSWTAQESGTTEWLNDTGSSTVIRNYIISGILKKYQSERILSKL